MRRIASHFEAEKQKQLSEELAQAEKDLTPCHRWRPSLRESERSWLSLKGAGTDPDAPCVPSVKRTCRMEDGRAVIPAMPNLVPAELSTWLEERHADLHDALVNNRILDLTTKLSEGAERMVEMVGGDGLVSGQVWSEMR